MSRKGALILPLVLLLLASAALAANVEADIDATHQAVENYVKRAVGTYESFQQFTLGNPAQKLYEVANRAKDAGLPKVMMSLATVIALSGFFVRGWSILAGGDGVSKRGVIVQTAAVAALLSVSFNNSANLSVSYTAMQSWSNAITWSNSKMSSAIDAKLKESSNILVGVLGKVAVTATTFAAPELRAIGAGTAKGAAGAAVKSTGQKAMKTMGSIGARLNFSLLFMQGLMIAYASIVFISGITVLAGIYLFPIAVAFTMWGQTKIVWTLIGSFIAAWSIALFLPLVTYLSVDKVFVEPARMAAQYEQQIGVVAKTSGLQSALVGERFDAEVDRLTRDCKARQEEDPTVSCLSDSGSGLIKSVWKQINASLDSALTLFKSTIGSLLDMIVSLAIQVFWGIAYYVFAIGAMFAVAGFLTNALGGAANNLGDAIKGRSVMRR
ncbi:hypothetical protein [Deinococcus phoenicis]|uniref:hypothetical protein n=1 Tax=Deinococcus phoenicis TaxID=1476583 RepID=UPI0005540A87|nr:hypothetical protein [Deinococcus phoenicis]